MAKKKAASRTRKPARTRAPLTRERILRTALAAADKGGLEAISMRALAAKLGVEAMSLYNHVRDKQDLLDGLVELILGEIAMPAAGTPWRAAMRARALGAREVFRRHPGAALIVESCVSMKPARLQYAERVIGLMRDDGFSVGVAYRGFLAIDSYVYGFVLQELGWPGRDAPTGPDAFPAVPRAAFPHFADTIAHLAEEVGRTSFGAAYDAEFEFGLDLLLDGLARLRRAPGAKAR